MKLFLLLSMVISYSSIQAQSADQETLTYYHFLYDHITYKGEKWLLVSETAWPTTCDVESAEYSRMKHAAIAWIKENYDATYEGKNPLRYALRKDRAAKEIGYEKEDQEKKGKRVLFVEYKLVCGEE